MKNIKKNKKNWFKAIVIAGIFGISLLNLSVNIKTNPDNLESSITLSSTMAMAEWWDNDNNQGGDGEGGVKEILEEWRNEKRECEQGGSAIIHDYRCVQDPAGAHCTPMTFEGDCCDVN